ncbi:MAG: hypothetical protein BWZ07_01386 [Alphaproteobacteria bacterium ADurb.BinA280]|nr:MAG: hypothetical protein BWZ07_01386 [Alphaproteobacteria bacterium ADurb.BinA280]
MRTGSDSWPSDSHCCSRFNRQQGVTLMELMVTIAIVGIVLSLALPSFNESMQRNRIAGQANDLMGALSLARMEAVRSNRPARVCASSDQATCGASWADGWIVLADPDGNGTEDLLRAGTISEKDTVTATATQFAFDGRGRRTAPPPEDDAGLQVQPTDCQVDFPFRREISITATGGVVLDDRADHKKCI